MALPTPRPVHDVTERRRAAAIAGHRRDARTARDLVGDPDPGVRATALAALARAGALEDDELAAALADPEPVVRRRAARLAVPRSQLSLVRLLHDPDSSVVEQAAWACGEREGPEPGLVAALASVAQGHTDPLCREAAVAALGAIGDEHGLPAVLAATGDRATVRRRAVIALAAFEGAQVDEARQRASQDRDWQVRQAVEDQLAAPPGPD